MLAGVAEGRGHSFDGLRRRDQCFRSVPLANTFPRKASAAEHTVLIENRNRVPRRGVHALSLSVRVERGVVDWPCEDSSGCASVLVLRRRSTIRCFRFRRMPGELCWTVLQTSPSRVEPRETSPAPARRRVPAHGREVMHIRRPDRAPDTNPFLLGSSAPSRGIERLRD